MKSLGDLKRKVGATRSGSVPAAFREAARRTLLAWVDMAETHRLDMRQALRRLRDGEAAVEVARAALGAQASDPTGPMAQADCRKGCAFCCILLGSDGGTMTGVEAARLHEALAPLADQPDGRDWHPSACAALDPETRLCRAYEARPAICRSYISPDAALCERVAQGEAVAGPGVLGGHTLYLSVLTLTREALRGVTAVPTYSLSKIASAAVEGVPLADALDGARHAPRELTEEIGRQKAALGR
ncbi:YkgJ family cysteine cluster protein [Silicimonas algicola]|uniref:Putative zinc-or iron-chelating protein n=1 Tax=Silicimonas algicola TaxID=1826607 RepID=A0A316GDH2_9RHOB|nr:YkgJ family cysteine cluster protein [Silicimonas algicola]AZQ65982.1 YkgJ family cysteine cluster protein [Silicimonas algicola]PWK58275.1 putative zinc- or iron-chelating protein [Silicimonas algicola]